MNGFFFLAAKSLVRRSAVVISIGAVVSALVPNGGAGPADGDVVVKSTRGGAANFSELAQREKGHPAALRKDKPARPRLRDRGEFPPVDPSQVVSGPTTRPIFGSAESASTEDGGFIPASTPPSPAPSANFQSVVDNGTQFNPDTQGAVGTNHIMVATQQGIQILNRFGALISQASQNTFWSGLGATDIYDPRLLYDPYAHRWIHVALADPGTNNAGLLVAVSQTSDPTGVWYRYNIDVDATAAIFPDSPNVGFARDIITVQANMYDKTNFFHYSFDFFVFSKTSLYSGAASPVFTNISIAVNGPNSLGSSINAPVPAATYDPTMVTNYLVGNWNANTTNGGFLQLYYIATNDCVFPPELQFTMAKASFELPFGGSARWDPFAPNDLNFAPQQGTTNKISMGDCRIQSCVFRNGSVWAAHTIFLPASGPATRASVQWWELTPPSRVGCSADFSGGTVLQRGRIDDPSGSRFYAYPSIAVSRANDVLVGYSRFAANQFPSANYSFRIDADVFSSLRGDTVLKPGEAKFYVDDLGLNHWGDWSAAVVDPNNDTELWTLQEYASSPVSGDDRWGIWWGRVSPPSDLSVTMTASTNALIAGSNITYSVTVVTTNSRIQVVGGVRLTNTLPAGSQLISAVPSQGSCGLTNGVVTCDFGNVGVTGRVTATLVVKLNNSGTINNTVAVSAHGPELMAANNTATASTTVSASADLVSLATAGPDPVTVSNRLTYNITVTNRGPTSANSVQVTNTLPPNVTFISHTPSQGSCSRNGNVVTCSLGTIAVNGLATVQIVATPNGPGMQTNRVSVGSASFEPVPSNNTNTVLSLANASPTIGVISDRTIDEDFVLFEVPFLVGDFETPAGSLVLTGFCSNPSLVPNANIMFGGIGANRTITVTPAQNASGMATITRIVTDSLGASATNSFMLEVRPVNDPPTINDTVNFTIQEDAPTNIVVMVGDAESPPSALTVSASSSNPTLVPNGNLMFAPGGTAQRTLTITPATNQSGSATINVTVGDGTNTTSDTFVLTVQEVNDPPSISGILDRSVTEDTQSTQIPFTVFDVETPGSNLVVTASSTNMALFPTNGFSFTIAGTNRTVTVLPGTNQFGTASVTLTVRDTNGATATSSFLLTVNPVNDPPNINPINPVTTNEDAGTVSIALTGINAGATNELQGLFVTATSSNPSFIPNPGVAYNSGSSTGLLTFASMPNSNGLATITVTVTDDGLSNKVTMRTFDVNILAVNDVPMVTDILDVAIPEDSNTGFIPFTIGDVESPVGALSLFPSSSDTSIVPLSGISFTGTGSNRFVTVSPLPNANGVCTIGVLVSDGQGTNTETFRLTVTSINDLPTISTLSDRMINEDSPTNVMVTVGDLETAPGNLTVVATSSNQGIVSNASLFVTNNGATRIIAINPVPNQAGSAQITVTVTDADNGSTNTSFFLNVTSVNDPPTLTNISDVTVNEDAGQQSITLTGISGGPAGEPQALSFSVMSSAPSIVPTPTIGYTNGNSTGVLRFTPAANATGDVTINVTVDDGASSNRTTMRTFVIHVLSQNDLPVLSFIDQQTVLEDAELVINFTASDVETSASNLLFTVFSTDQEIIPDAGLMLTGAGTNRTLKLRGATNTFGSATIVIEATDGDGGTTNSIFEVMILQVNDAPGVVGLTNVTINRNTSTGAMPFTVDDPDSDISVVSLTVTSSNQGLVPQSNLDLRGSLRNRTLAVTPVANLTGTSIITVFATDGSATSSNGFILTVLGPNTPPTISDIGNQTIAEDGTTGQINFNIGDLETPTSGLQLTAASTDTALLPTNNIIFGGGTGPNRTVTVSPVANRSGMATITITVTDGSGAVASDPFTVNVTAVNDPPTFNVIPNLTTNEDSGQITIQLSGISPGPNESGSVTFQTTSDNPSLIPTPQVNYTPGSSTAVLTCTPALNATGVATIRVTANDGLPPNNLFARTFSITITQANDRPTISAINNQSMFEDGVLTVPFTVDDVDTAALALMVSATSTNPAVLPATNIFFSGAGANRTITFVPLPNQFGTSLVTVAVSDGLASSSNSFLVSVISVNDTPTLDPLTNVNVAVSPGAMSVPLRGISAGAPNETESLQVTVTNNAPGNFWTTTPAVTYSGGATGILNFRPANSQSGSVTLGVVVNDLRTSNNIFARTFLLNVRANGNTAPSITTIQNQSVFEDTVINSLNFTVADAETPAASLVVTALSTNEVLFPNGNIQLTGTTGSRFITLTPATNRSGVTLISLTVRDTAGGASNMNFTVTVSPQNDAPTITPISSLTTPANTPTSPILFDVRDVETAPGSLQVTATSGNTTLVPNGNIFLGGSGTNRALVITPATGQSGSALITVSVNDGTAGNSSAFTLTVSGPPAPPTLRIELVSGYAAAISWPSASGPNWTLLGNTNLSFSANWTTIPSTPMLVGGRYWVTNFLTVDPAKYFRVRSP